MNVIWFVTVFDRRIQQQNMIGCCVCNYRLADTLITQYLQSNNLDLKETEWISDKFGEPYSDYDGNITFRLFEHHLYEDVNDVGEI